jgi:serine/threonine protein phosphatase PrpC
MTKWSGTVRTDIGLKRSNNEDSYFMDSEIGLFLVADGMGGAASGEVASKLVAETVGGYIRHYSDQPTESTDRFHFFDGQLSPRANTLMQAIHLANRMVFDTARDNPRHQGMGSTVAVILADGDTILAAHVGDSRIFRFRNGILERLTTDHRVADDPNVKRLVEADASILTDMGNTLTRAMGIRSVVEPDLARFSVEEGDIYLMCSDGLSDLVDEEMIADVLALTRSLDRKVRDLIELALANGGRDNITVLLAEPIQVGRLKGILNKITKNN